MKICAVIPARMAATRFPNKPMFKILDMTMIEHVYRRTKLCKDFDEVYVATCDQEIYDHISEIGGKAVMTKDTHERCTDRTAEAILKIERDFSDSYEAVFMVQGDEPLLSPQSLHKAVEEFKKKGLAVLNIINPIHSDEDFLSLNTVKVVLNQKKEIMYFSREAIPSKQRLSHNSCFKQTGLILFKKQALLDFYSLPTTPLENIESCDMLRFVEQDIKIQAFIDEYSSIGVDVAEQVSEVEQLLKNDTFYPQYKR